MTPSKIGKTAFAIFVKTPGLSRVKTRLGHKVGELKAKKFYELSLKKITSELKKLVDEVGHDKIDIYWAIAEPFNQMHATYWKDFNFIHQADGQLGTRISSIYNQLIESGYDKVILMGSDSPQLTVSDYKKWYSSNVSGQQVVMGPATDGGFYSFVGASAISSAVWESVAYSEATTSSQLDEGLTRAGFNVFYLNKEMDIDFYEDLELLNTKLLESSRSSIEQTALLDYISSVRVN